MKSTPILLFFLVFTLLQCQSNQEAGETSSGLITISGEIKSMENDNQLYYSTTSSYEDLKLADSTFNISLESDIPQLVTFIYNRRNWEVFVKPGDQVQMVFDRFDLANFAKAIQFEGDNKAENDFLGGLKEKVEVAGPDLNRFFMAEETAFLQLVDSVKNVGLASLKNFLSQNKKVDKAFKQLAEQYVVYSTANYLNQYPDYHRYFSQNSDYEPGVALLKAQAEVPLENPALIGLPAYVQFLDGFLASESNIILQENPELQNQKNGFLITSLQVIQENLKDPIINELMRFARLRDQFDFFGIEGAEQPYRAFLAEAKNEKYKNTLEGLYAKWEHLKPGKEAPIFSYPNLEGKLYSLNDFKGKYVYIDVWATWCAPCIREQPFLEEIEEKYKGNDNIVFLGISIDENKKAWEEMVVAKEMKGIQLIADAAWQSKLNIDYNIKAIPRFLFIDKEGKIISSDADRPSSEALKEKLAELL